MSDTIIDAIIAELKIELRRRHEALAEVRAELAAEKERTEHWKASWHAADKTVRTRNKEIAELEDAAAIRASNAAPVDAKQSCAESNSCAEGEISWEEACAVGARIAKAREDV